MHPPYSCCLCCHCRDFTCTSSNCQTYFFSQNKSATSNQPAILFSQNKLASAISQTNKLAKKTIHIISSFCLLSEKKTVWVLTDGNYKSAAASVSLPPPEQHFGEDFRKNRKRFCLRFRGCCCGGYQRLCCILARTWRRYHRPRARTYNSDGCSGRVVNAQQFWANSDE
jgi:hypothetical protein